MIPAALKTKRAIWGYAPVIANCTLKLLSYLLVVRLYSSLHTGVNRSSTSVGEHNWPLPWSFQKGIVLTSECDSNRSIKEGGARWGKTAWLGRPPVNCPAPPRLHPYPRPAQAQNTCSLDPPTRVSWESTKMLRRSNHFIEIRLFAFLANIGAKRADKQKLFVMANPFPSKSIIFLINFGCSSVSLFLNARWNEAHTGLKDRLLTQSKVFVNIKKAQRCGDLPSRVVLKNMDISLNQPNSTVH